MGRCGPAPETGRPATDGGPPPLWLPLGIAASAENGWIAGRTPLRELMDAHALFDARVGALRLYGCRLRFLHVLPADHGGPALIVRVTEHIHVIFRRPFGHVRPAWDGFRGDAAS